MAATTNVSQLQESHNSSVPKHGVLTLTGYEISVRVDRGHLVIEDAIGADRQHYRLPRVGHRLKRLVVVGFDGCLSLAALRWLADQDIALAMLERNGKVLLATGPVRTADARLRRRQALAPQTGLDVVIARELISQKLAGQEEVARDKLNDGMAARQIADCRLGLAEAETLDAVRALESQGAAAYFSAWRTVRVLFPKSELGRVPEHWRTLEARKSPLSGSPRLASNPINAILNYLYSLLEAESRLALAALGLEPGLGFLHVDTPARDSLACDVMEAVRPKVDALVLDRIGSGPLKREWFFEQRDGNCRLMSCFTARLSETSPMWARAVAPFAEWVARQLWSATRKGKRESAPPTHLTQQHKREAKGLFVFSPVQRPLRRENLCRGCGKDIAGGRTHCAQCAIPDTTERLLSAGRIGRVLAHSPTANLKRANTQQRNAIAQHSWKPEYQPAWLTERVFSEQIQPRLTAISTSTIASALQVSRMYASRIRQGERPHPRHWQKLAEIAGISHAKAPGSLADHPKMRTLF